MIIEDDLQFLEQNSIDIPSKVEESIINQIFNPCIKKMESFSSVKSTDVYFKNESSKLTPNSDNENKANERESFNIMEDYDKAFRRFIEPDDNFEDDLLDEKEDNLMMEGMDNFPHFFNHAADNSIDDGINICLEDKYVIVKGKNDDIDIPEKKIELEDKITNQNEETVKPKMKLKRGKRGPYKKKSKKVTKTKTNDKCFPFTSGNGILSGEKLYGNNIFKTNVYFTDTDGVKKKEKKQRKYKPDDIRKKIKVRFHKKIKNIINENLKKAGSNELFSFIPQFFIGNISKKFNNQYMNATYEELLSINFADFQKEYFNKECDYKQWEKNKKTLEYLNNNPEISAISGFDKVKKMKYKDIINAYFSSTEFENSIEQLKKEKESDEYIQEYIFLSSNYIEYFTVFDDYK